MCAFGFRLFVQRRYSSLQQTDKLLISAIVFFDVRRQRVVDNVLMQLRLQPWQIRPFTLSNAIRRVFIQFEAVVVIVAICIEEIDVRLNVRRIRFEFWIINRSGCGRCHAVATSRANDVAMMLKTAAKFRFVFALPFTVVVVIAVVVSARLQFVMLHELVMAPMPFVIVVAAMGFCIACRSSLCNETKLNGWIAVNKFNGVDNIVANFAGSQAHEFPGNTAQSLCVRCSCNQIVTVNLSHESRTTRRIITTLWG